MVNSIEHQEVTTSLRLDINKGILTSTTILNHHEEQSLRPLLPATGIGIGNGLDKAWEQPRKSSDYHEVMRNMSVKGRQRSNCSLPILYAT